LSDFHEIAVTIIHKYLLKKVGFWDYKLIHKHGVRSSEVLPIEKEEKKRRVIINPLNAEINPICPLLALLGAHHILHVSR